MSSLKATNKKRKATATDVMNRAAEQAAWSALGLRPVPSAHIKRGHSNGKMRGVGANKSIITGILAESLSRSIYASEAQVVWRQHTTTGAGFWIHTALMQVLSIHCFTGSFLSGTNGHLLKIVGTTTMAYMIWLCLRRLTRL